MRGHVIGPSVIRTPAGVLGRIGPSAVVKNPPATGGIGVFPVIVSDAAVWRMNSVTRALFRARGLHEFRDLGGEIVSRAELTVSNDDTMVVSLTVDTKAESDFGEVSLISQHVVAATPEPTTTTLVVYPIA